MSSSKI